MSTRRARRARRNTAPAWAIAAVVGLVLAAAAPSLLGAAVLLAATGAGAMFAWHRLEGRPPAELIRERDALARELTATRAALEGAQAEARQHQARADQAERRANEALEAMHAAWDASTAPRAHAEHDGADPEATQHRAAVLADPRSGARPLISPEFPSGQYYRRTGQ